MPSLTQHPSLTPDGWTNSSIHVADQMLSDFFLSEYSQTFCWPGKVKSFPWMLQRYSDDPIQLAGVAQEALLEYLSKQFTDCNVEVTSKEESTSINRHSLYFFVSFTDTKGETFNLNKLIQVSNSKVLQIMNILKG